MHEVRGLLMLVQVQVNNGEPREFHKVRIDMRILPRMKWRSRLW